jgi:hypothetical protein
MKGDKQEVVNYREISIFNAWYKLYSTVLNENWKYKYRSSVWNARMDSEKTDLASSYCLVWNYL